MSEMAIGERAPGKAELAYETIREAILAGELEPGAAIDKSALCESLGVSRYPVTSAIGRLAFERLVRIAPQRGSFVAPISAGDVREVLFLRGAVESAVAARAAAELDEAARAALTANLDAAQAAAEARDRARFYALDVAFHAGLTAPLNLQRTAEMLDVMHGRLQRARRLMMIPPARPLATLSEHRAIFAAISSRDAEAARRAMAAHIGAVLENFETLAREKPNLFTP
jgi:DNA-binding GntR family transcriptional regulator